MQGFLEKNMGDVFYPLYWQESTKIPVNSMQDLLVLFDVDGTVADTEHLAAAVTFILFAQTLEKNELSQYRVEGKELTHDVLTGYVGWKPKDIFNDLLNNYFQDMPKEEKEQQLKHLLSQKPKANLAAFQYGIEACSMFPNGLEPVKPIDGAIEFLQKLQNNNIPYMFVTNSDPGRIALTFELTGLDRFVHQIEHTHPDAGDPFSLERNVLCTGEKCPIIGNHLLSKPSPHSYLGAAASMGVNPLKCVVVEDSCPGIEAGEKFGAGLVIATTKGSHCPADYHEKISSFSRRIGKDAAAQEINYAPDVVMKSGDSWAIAWQAMEAHVERLKQYPIEQLLAPPKSSPVASVFAPLTRLFNTQAAPPSPSPLSTNQLARQKLNALAPLILSINDNTPEKKEPARAVQSSRPMLSLN
ncbi:MAG: HAD family hydrolase [Alphaproteobacteria bacterium]